MKYTILRFEHPDEYRSDDMPLKGVGKSEHLTWRDVCEQINLVLGQNSLQFGKEPTTMVTVFKKDEFVVVILQEKED